MAAWECPFCGLLAVEHSIQQKNDVFSFTADTKYGDLHCATRVVVCPNPECKEFTYTVSVSMLELQNSRYGPGKLIENWVTRPQGIVKSFPDYIPMPILSDYREAALIRDLSPKASATLARRCLQGMIRNFWNVREKNLFEEIKAIEDRVDSDTWHAIDAIRSIGNIGAHMEKDIDVIIDVDSDEAGLLISLIETLINDWYIERENRRRRSQLIVAAALQKKELKQQK